MPRSACRQFQVGLTTAGDVLAGLRTRAALAAAMSAFPRRWQDFCIPRELLILKILNQKHP